MSTAQTSTHSAAIARSDVEVAWLFHGRETYSVEVCSPIDTEPEEIYGSLAAVGFVEDERFAAPPPDSGLQERKLVGPAGSGLFGEWTIAERERHLAAVTRALLQLGYGDIPTYDFAPD